MDKWMMPVLEQKYIHLPDIATDGEMDGWMD